MYILDKTFHNMDDRSWEASHSASYNNTSASSSLHNDSTTSQSHLHMINSLVDSNSILTKQNESMAEEITSMRKQLQEKSEEIAKMKLQVSKLQDTASNEKTSTKKVNPTISRELKSLYDSLAEENKFLPQQNLSHNSNKTVFEELRTTLVMAEFDAKDVEYAIKRKFYQERKNFKEDDAAVLERRRRGRRHNKYRKRLGAAKKMKHHLEVIESLNVSDMSDEESLDGSTFKIKKPTWRSPDVDAKLKEIDQSFAACNKSSVTKKKRVLGSPSARTK